MLNFEDYLDGADPAESLGNISRERRAVEELLASPEAPAIYGFNTLFGHLDSVGMGPGDQARLLQNHLIGPVVESPESWIRLLARVKWLSISRGGTGISAEAAKIIYSAGYNREFRILKSGGNWSASYGSGDVVPGAWFVDSIFSREQIDSMLPGDLMSIINGHFVSTSAGIVANELFRSFTENVLSLCRVAKRLIMERDSRTQYPVTVRDLGPLEDSIDYTTRCLEGALRFRLESRSGNPLFTFQNGDVEPLSNSSFLDFRLTSALDSASKCIVICCQYLRGFVAFLQRENAAGSNSLVQPSKVMGATILEIGRRGPGWAGGTLLQESEGVEDACDESLQSGIRFVNAIMAAARVQHIANEMMEIVLNVKVEKYDQIGDGVSSDIDYLSIADFLGGL